MEHESNHGSDEGETRGLSLRPAWATLQSWRQSLECMPSMLGALNQTMSEKGGGERKRGAGSLEEDAVQVMWIMEGPQIEEKS